MCLPYLSCIKRLLHSSATLKSLRRLLRRLSMTSPQPDADLPQNSADSPFDPSKPVIPISYPIKTMQDLLSRTYFDSFHFPFNKASTGIPPSSSSLAARPRMLVCHDMEGGYVDDKWVQGGANSDAYAIWHWYLIDVFVYFSHNLVTLPPPCWTNAGHAHGVKVLGTFITEWDEGRAACDVLLSTKESSHLYAERLTELAAALGFDGWLLNMEVNLDLAQIPNLKEFISHLTKTMHTSVPGSLVIWYDSVTKDGNLSWQNQLNEYNKPFFDLCDGIFANYTWKEGYPKQSASVAGERKLDVYMGIDVFGRGTFGGGQWTTNVALDVLKKDDVSAALFAPGWVYETKQPPDFQTAQNRWWGLVEKSWGIVQKYPKVLPFYSNFDQGHGLHIFLESTQVSSDSWNNISSQTFQPILDGSSDPPQSTIEASINFNDSSYSGGDCITFNGTIEDGSSISIRLFEAELPLGDLPVYITYSDDDLYPPLLVHKLKLNLYNCCVVLPCKRRLVFTITSFVMEDENISISKPSSYEPIYIIGKSYAEGDDVFISLFPLWGVVSGRASRVNVEGSSLLGVSVGFTKTSERASILLVPKGQTFPPPKQLTSKFDKVITAFQISTSKTEKLEGKGLILQQASIKMKNYTLTDINVVCYKEGKIRFTDQFSKVVESSTTEYHASLGHISIRSSGENMEFPPASSWFVTGENVQWGSGSQGTKTVSLKINWKLKSGSGDTSFFLKYNIYLKATPKEVVDTDSGNSVGIDGKYLGVAKVESFYVADLIVPDGVSQLLFIIQVCSIDGGSQKLEESPIFQLQVV